MDPPHFVSPREKLNVYSWRWLIESEVRPGIAPQEKFAPVTVTEDNRNVLFHWGYSNGTAVVRGDQPFTSGHNYYWEIQICTAPYGTDVMVGVGTADVTPFLSGEYVSLLGIGEDSWGFSYTGKFHHKTSAGAPIKDYYRAFGMGDVVGLHLDTWFSTLTLFVNGVETCVVKDKSLKKLTLYPMMCSTSASTCLKLIYSYSSRNLLQNICLKRLECDQNVMGIISNIPGLSKECTKRFLKVNEVIRPLVSKACKPVKQELENIADDTDSSEEEYDKDIPCNTNKRKVKCVEKDWFGKCVTCRQSTSVDPGLCSACINLHYPNVDVYDSI